MLGKELLSHISNSFAEYDKETEVEFRFGSFINDRYKGSVNRRVYDRFLDFFGKRITPREENTEDYVNGPIRKRVFLATPDTEEKIQWIRKDRIYSYDSPEYPYRLSISRERSIEPVDNFHYKIIRNKHRLSYFLYNDSFRLDITTVQEINNITKTSYEIELEIIKRSFNPEILNKVLLLVLTQLLDTEVLYTEKERKEILNIVNGGLSGKSQRGRTGVDPGVLMQSRSLKVEDMIWGGLVGNSQTSYSVTHKADGLRKLLVFAPSGVWLIMPPGEVNLLTPRPIGKLNGIILDGEYIPPESRTSKLPATKYWYLAFDCLSSNTFGSPSLFDPSIQGKRLNERMEVCQVVASITQNLQSSSLLYVNTKTFYNFSSPETFYKRMREMFSQQPSLGYREDGFIFTALNLPYNTESDKFPLYKRILTQIPDNLKWKPPSLLTIDFAVDFRATSTGREVIVLSREKGKYLPFHGTKRYPLLGIKEESSLLDFPSHTVVEFRVEDSQLIPVRVREKPYPNRTEVAIDIWSDAHSPLTEETLKGNNFTLVRRYHNNIKRELLKSLPEGSTILDLGSGRGSDIGKWKKFSRVLSIEPSEEMLKEFRTRLTNSKVNNVSVLQAKAQDTEKITNFVSKEVGKVDAVTMFLSMTFFWESPEILKGVIKTIQNNLKEGGKILFFTIDGNAVQQTFAPRHGLSLKELKLGNNYMIYEEDPLRLTLHFPGTIIENQIEPLVFLEDLEEYFKLEVNRADKQKFLTPEESIFSNFYTYGTGTIRVMNNLTPLEVTYNPDTEISYGLDVVEEINVPWFSDLVRVSAINEGSSFFHALLNAFYQPYREALTYIEKVDLVVYLRRDLAFALGEKYPLVYSGVWQDMGLTPFGEKFTLPALQAHINSKENIGEPFYEYVAHSLGVDVYVLKGDRFLPRLYTGVNNPGVVLLDIEGNIELIGKIEKGDIVTIFPPEDPLLSEIRKRLS